MGELVQLLTAAESAQNRQDLQALLNQHAQVINSQAAQIQTLQTQLDIAIERHNAFLGFQAKVSIGTVLGLLLCMAVSLLFLNRKISRSRA